MDRLVFRAALRASAKVAFTAAIFGCGGGTALPGPAGQEAPHADASSGHDGATPDHDILADAMAQDSASPGDSTGSDGSAGDDAGGDGGGGLLCMAPEPSTLFPEATHAGVNVTEATFTCCLDLLEPLVGEGGSELGDAGMLDPAARACCGAVVYRLDAEEAEAGFDSPDRKLERAKLGFMGQDACCRSLKEPMGVTCTPWGPPVPPAMDDEAFARGHEAFVQADEAFVRADEAFARDDEAFARDDAALARDHRAFARDHEALALAVS